MDCQTLRTDTDRRDIFALNLTPDEFSLNENTAAGNLAAPHSNTETEFETFADYQNRKATELMKNPLSTEKAFAYFGAMLGLFPPFAIFSKIVVEKFMYATNSDDFWLISLFVWVNFVCAAAGYFAGKLIGKITKEIEESSWSGMILMTPFLGLFWGVLTGGIGGIFLFLIGAVFGAVIASIVGATAFPGFVILHRALKKGDKIEERHFFPIALGIAGVITALIVSFK